MTFFHDMKNIILFYTKVAVGPAHEISSLFTKKLMRDFLPHDWWEDLDGDIKGFQVIEELLNIERTSYCWQHERIDWDRHVERLLHSNRFHIRYRMPLEDFDALVQLLGDEVVPNFAMSRSRRCDKAIYPQMMVAIGRRVLAGGNYDDIMNTDGITSRGGALSCS
jgi:hypothetical protein